MNKTTPEQKRANKIGKAIQKILGDKTQFVLVSYSEDIDNGRLETLSNIQSKFERIGILEVAKNDTV